MPGMSLLIIDMLNIASDEANSSPSPTGMTVATRPSSTSSSIARPRTRSSASRTKRRRTFGDSSRAPELEMTAIWGIERIRKTDRGYLSEPE